MNERNARTRLSVLTLGVVTLLTTGCVTSERARFTARLDESVAPARAETPELAIAFGLDEFAMPEGVLADATDQ